MMKILQLAMELISESHRVEWQVSRVIRIFATALMIITSFGSVAASEIVNVKQVSGLTADKMNETIHNSPHWNENMCDSCHQREPRPGRLSLYTDDINELCNSCHEKLSSHLYIHPYGMRPSKKIMQKMSATFKNAVSRGKGKLTCISCHDLHLTCLKKNSQARAANTRFFRSGPYPNRTEFCYECHDRKSYQRFNPHDQVDAKGKLRESTCTVCHRDTKKLSGASSIHEVDFNYEGELSSMCAGCHPVKPHPGGSFQFFSTDKGPNHLVVPPESIKKQLDKMQQVNQVLMPLEPGTGKIFCATCHNPHAKGVIKNEAASMGAGSEKKLRVKKICTNCHDK